jgi:hypothetical protein
MCRTAAGFDDDRLFDPQAQQLEFAARTWLRPKASPTVEGDLQPVVGVAPESQSRMNLARPPSMIIRDGDLVTKRCDEQRFMRWAHLGSNHRPLLAAQFDSRQVSPHMQAVHRAVSATSVDSERPWATSRVVTEWSRSAPHPRRQTQTSLARAAGPSSPSRQPHVLMYPRPLSLRSSPRGVRSSRARR